MQTRTKDLYLFNYDHFKEPDNSRKEQLMQWELFTSKAKLRLTEHGGKVIITCGYEIPLGEVMVEKKRIDLVAYDKDGCLYVIETKFTHGSGTANKAAQQVSAYAKELVKNILVINQKFQQELNKSWYLKEPFTKLVLAPRCYYEHKRKPDSSISDNVLYFTFKHTDEYHGLKSVLGDEGFVDLTEYKWK